MNMYTESLKKGKRGV